MVRHQPGAGAGSGGTLSIICRPLPSCIAGHPSGSFIAASGARPDSDIQRSRSHEVMAISARNWVPVAGAGRTPAEELLEDYHARWGSNIDPVFTDYAY